MDSFFATPTALYSHSGRLDPWNWCWVEAPIPTEAKAVCAVEALMRLRTIGGARHLPVGLIGPRDASPAQLDTAKSIGARIGQLGLTMICGGKGGVMAAAAQGCHDAGGLSVGLIPDSDWRQANPSIALPLATGLGEARNMVIAKSCVVLIAIGNSYGTLSEIAYGLHFSKAVIGLVGAPKINGLIAVKSPEDAITKMAQHLMNAAEQAEHTSHAPSKKTASTIRDK